MRTIARILLLSGLACFVFNEGASAQTFYCNIHHNCPNDGRIMTTAGFSKAQCRKVKNKKGKAIAKSWGNGPASPQNTCQNVR